MLALLGAGCGGSTSPQRNPLTLQVQPASRTKSDEPKPLAYLPSDRAIGYGERFFEGRGRALAGGVRVVNQDLSVEVPEPHLYGGIALPPRMGSGFLFWNEVEIFRSRTFLGTLDPVGRTPERPSPRHALRASIGPSEVLVHFQEGGRMVWSPKLGWGAPMPTPGLIDWAALEDGRAVELREPNQLWVRARGRSEFVAREPPPFNADWLDLVSGEILLKSESGEGYALSETGNFVVSGREPSRDRRDNPMPKDPRWTSAKSPREQAYRGGVPVAEGQAIVDANGAFAKVDVRSGAVLAMTGEVVSEPHECRLLPMVNDVMAVCTTKTLKPVVIAGLAQMKPRIERTSKGSGNFYTSGPGTLLQEGPCEPNSQTAKAFPVCIRQASGEWHERSIEYDKVAKAAGYTPVVMVRWIPTPDGGAIGIVRGEKGGIAELETGKFLPFPEKIAAQAVELLKAPQTLLTDDFTVSKDNQLWGYGASSLIGITATGTLVPPAKELKAIAHRGSFALGREDYGKFWQSTDYGRTWVPVPAPPGYGLRNVPMGPCSLVGCVVGDWYRVGFSSQSLETSKTELPHSAPLLAPKNTHRLECKTQRVLEQGKIKYTKGDNKILVLGERTVPKPRAWRGEGDNNWQRYHFLSPPVVESLLKGASRILRAETLLDSSDMSPTVPRLSRSLRFQIPFSRPHVHETQVTWTAVERAMKGANIHDPLYPDPDKDGFALPILSRARGRADGILLLSSSASPAYGLWARENLPLTTHPTLLGSLSGYVTSAGAAQAGQLMVAIEMKGRSQVRGFTPESPVLINVKRLSGSGPTHPDMLALSTEGEPALIRIGSLGTPTRDDPALLLLAKGSPRTLAPWSTLEVGSCENNGGYRAIVDLAGWLDVSVDGKEVPIFPSIMAMVDWSPERVCLEALEVAIKQGLSQVGAPMPVSIGAEFGAMPGAYMYWFNLGEASVEQLDCHLTKNVD